MHELQARLTNLYSYSNNLIYDEENKFVIINTDVLQLLKNIPSESCNLAICDPPYYEVFGKFDFNQFANSAEYLQ